MVKYPEILILDRSFVVAAMASKERVVLDPWK